MPALRAIRVHLRSLLRRSAVERELDEELRGHMDRDVERLVAQGMSSADAHRAVRRAFGNVEYLKEESRDARGLPVVEHLVRDLGYALRLARTHRAFSVVVVLSLALGLGAATAVFNLTYNVLLAPLALPHPERLVALARERGGERDLAFSPNDYRSLRETPGIGTLAAVRTASQIAIAAGEAREYVNMHFVDGAFFPVLGLRPVRGRLISSDDDARRATLVVLSEALAERLFPGDSSAVGRTVDIRGTTFTVIGITPRSFRGLEHPGQFAAAIPLSTVELLARAGDRGDDRGIALGLTGDRWGDQRALRIFGRLATSRASTATALGVAFGRCCATRAVGVAAGANERLEVLDIRRGLPGTKDDTRATVGTMLLVLLAGMGLLVAVVCCNIASLLVVRASARQREIAVRLSLGASRGRVVSQLVLETLPLAAAGGALGLVFAAWATAALVTSVAEWDSYAHLLTFHPGTAVLAFAGAATTGCAIAFAAYPALRATGGDLAHALRMDARSSRARHQRAMARGVVAAQVALTVVLVTAATLLAVTPRNLARVDGGFATDEVLMVSLDARGTPYEQRGVGPLRDEILTSVRAIPRVRAAAMASMLPMFGGTTWSAGLRVPGYEAAAGARPSATVNAVMPGYFQAMAIALRAGRDFDPGDRAGAEPVAIVSESLARRAFGDDRPLGRSLRVALGGDTLTPVRVVGIASDAKYLDLRAGPEPLVYVPLAQATETWNSLQVALRTRGTPSGATPAVRRAIEAAAPGIRIRRVSDMHARLEVATALPRLAARVAVFASAMVLALSLVGLYGVVAYGVARRTRELGVRMALGARAPSIVWLVAREMIGVVAIGSVTGLALSFAANGALASQLYGVGAHDPLIMALSVLLIGAVALLAGAIPARRATRIDPTIALAAE